MTEGERRPGGRGGAGETFRWSDTKEGEPCAFQRESRILLQKAAKKRGKKETAEQKREGSNLFAGPDRVRGFDPKGPTDFAVCTFQNLGTYISKGEDGKSPFRGGRGKHSLLLRKPLQPVREEEGVMLFRGITVARRNAKETDGRMEYSKRKKDFHLAGREHTWSKNQNKKGGGGLLSLEIFGERDRTKNGRDVVTLD